MDEAVAVAGIALAEVDLLGTVVAAAIVVAAALINAHQAPVITGLLIIIAHLRQRIGHRPIVPTAVILILVTIFRFLPVSAFLAAIGSAVTITPTLITIFAAVSFRPANTIWNRSKIPPLETSIKLKCPAAIGKPSLASPKLFLFYVKDRPAYLAILPALEAPEAVFLFQIFSRIAFFIFFDFFHCPLRHNISATLAAFRPKINYPASIFN